MDSHSVFPFLRLPAEIRLEIYRHAWTVPEVGYLYVYRYNGIYDGNKGLKLTLDCLKAQLSAIRKLGAISQRIRAEVYPEYFDHTQIMLRYDDARCFDSWNTHAFPLHNARSWDKRNRSALYILGGSYLLQTQAKHVHLHWPARIEDPGIEIYMDESRIRARDQEVLLNEQWAIECVSRFKNLKSLVVHVDDGSAKVMTDSYWEFYMHKLDEHNPKYHDTKELIRMFYDDERRAKLIEGLKTHHRKLEKAVVRTDISDPKVVKLINEHEAFEWWRQLKKDIAILALEGPSSTEEEKQDAYVFKQHIGNLEPCWPTASTV
ncbi:hypothetical protein QBC32DRAFT_379001 [Pseudoneurospora amorphoporcata]|uniref:Uncharacterized protein n=1 Tax=Pseudoneurospora amorphoporcata TaxID=241081 RepID=A0AAN6P2E8_9PEZI|nr:hypothetical protein QBC32DRAFT_379001 [Pseudoneurospora amorphoporcata]